MPAWLTPMLPGIAAGAANFIGGLFNNRANRQEARTNRQFQERMSNTGYQRAAADLEAAGLNKYAMYQGTHAASTPGGSMAQQQNPIDAVNARLAAAQTESIKAQADKTKEEALALKAERSIREVTGPGEPTWRDEQIAARRARLRDMAFEGTLQPHMLREAILDVMKKDLGIPQARAEAEFYRTFGSAAIGIDKLSGPAATAAGALGLSAAALARLLKGGPGSSARGIEALRGLFRAPVPIRRGDWSRYPKPEVPRTDGYRTYKR